MAMLPDALVGVLVQVLTRATLPSRLGASRLAFTYPSALPLGTSTTWKGTIGETPERFGLGGALTVSTSSRLPPADQARGRPNEYPLPS